MAVISLSENSNLLYFAVSRRKIPFDKKSRRLTQIMRLHPSAYLSGSPVQKEKLKKLDYSVEINQSCAGAAWAGILPESSWALVFGHFLTYLTSRSKHETVICQQHRHRKKGIIG
jgi:hypothetical protein